MFSNLSKGSILYGLYTKEGIKVFTGTIDAVTAPMPKSMPTTFGQMPEMVVNITATVEGSRKEFKQIPSNSAIADFGSDAFVLADNKESMINYVSSMLQTSKSIVESVDKHKALIKDYEEALNVLSPNTSTDVKALKEEVGDLKSQLAEVLSLLKQTK